MAANDYNSSLINLTVWGPPPFHSFYASIVYFSRHETNKPPVLHPASHSWVKAALIWLSHLTSCHSPAWDVSLAIPPYPTCFLSAKSPVLLRLCRIPFCFHFLLLSRLKTILYGFVVKATPPRLIHEGQKSRRSVARFSAQCRQGLRSRASSAEGWTWGISAFKLLQAVGRINFLVAEGPGSPSLAAVV